MAEDGDFFCAMGVHARVMDGPIFNRLQLGTAFSRQLPLYFPRLSCMYVNLYTCNTGMYVNYMYVCESRGK